MKWQLTTFKASALQFVILVSVIVAILLSSFLLLVYTHSSFQIRSKRLINNIEVANKGIIHALDPSVKVGDSLKIILDEVPVSTKESYRGSFEKIVSTAGKDSQAFSKAALLGRNNQDFTGLYLENNQLPLVVVGETKIVGDTYLPENKIKAGNISGTYYSRNTLVYGRRYSSNNVLPPLEEKWCEYIKNMAAFVPNPTENVVGLESINNSFYKERQIIYQIEKIVLDETIKGNVIIKSETEIEVTSRADLDQVLLIAPKVVFKESFQGSVHVIAEKIKTEKNTVFNYPSSFIGYRANEKEEHPISSQYYIEIGPNSKFQGNIISLNAGDERNRNDLLIEEGALIEGNVYCEGYAELKGTVLGSFFTRFFVAKHSGSVYINHIYNGRILANNKAQQSSGILLSGKQKNVALWLY